MKNYLAISGGFCLFRCEDFISKGYIVGNFLAEPWLWGVGIGVFLGVKFDFANGKPLVLAMIDIKLYCIGGVGDIVSRFFKEPSLALANSPFVLLL